MVGDMTWAIVGAGLVVLGVVIGWTAYQGPPEGLSQTAHVGSSGPAVTAFAVADQRQPQQSWVGEEPSDDPCLVERQVGEALVAVRARGRVEQRRRRRAAG